jgi:hypothetical protein
MKTERRLVTDAEAVSIRHVASESEVTSPDWDEPMTFMERSIVDALLSTREELLAVLEQIEFASTDALSRRRASEALALRG